MLITHLPWYFSLCNVVQITYAWLGSVEIAMSMTCHLRLVTYHETLYDWWLIPFSYLWFGIILLGFHVLFLSVTKLYFLIHISYITFVLIWLMPIQFVHLLPYPCYSQSALTCLSWNPDLFSFCYACQCQSSIICNIITMLLILSLAIPVQYGKCMCILEEWENDILSPPTLCSSKVAHGFASSHHI
jgi:hypothetical protein